MPELGEGDLGAPGADAGPQLGRRLDGEKGRWFVAEVSG
jgi:hypothetical protein